ncbi:MAG: S9 family peptidase [Vicinamibacterales bacterium]
MRCSSALIAVAVLLLSIAPPRAQAQSRRTFNPEDLLAVRSFAGGQPYAVSSTGRWIAYVITDQADDWNVQEPRPTGHLFVQGLGGAPAPPRALTTGAAHSAFPVWSPDGRRLAFVREEQNQGREIIWDAERDQMTPVGDAFTARMYLAPQWDATGRTLIVAASQPAPPPTPYRVRSVKSTDARIPGDQFFTDERKASLVAIDLASGRSTALVASPIVLRSFRLSPSGGHLLYVAPDPATLGIIGKEQNDTFVLAVNLASGSTPTASRKLSDRGRYSWSPDGKQLVLTKGGRLVVVPVEGGEPKPWRASYTLAGEPVWAPDGSRFATLVADRSVTDPELEPVKPGMYTTARPFNDVYVVGGAGAAKNITADIDDQTSDLAWSADGAALYFRATNNKTYDETLYRYTVADGKREVVVRGAESYDRFTPITGGVVASVEDATHAPDLWLIGADGGRTRITTLNSQLDKFAFSKPELFDYHNADGDRLGALLYKPAGLGTNAKVPVITWIYEKMTPAIHRFNARDQMFISHGYAMLMPNVKVKVGQTADSFEKCVVPAVNAVREMGFTSGKFGLWGHSFGAYAVSNLITRTNIFTAAVSGATPVELFRNWASGRDRDSRNIETGQARMGGSPYEYPERYFSQSGFFRLDQVNTPVLILHGEKDLTILFGEGEMMFYALRQLGKTAEFVSYANGDHSLSRHSKADALDANHRILEWFDRYLKGEGTAKSQ